MLQEDEIASRPDFYVGPEAIDVYGVGSIVQGTTMLTTLELLVEREG